MGYFSMSRTGVGGRKEVFDVARICLYCFRQVGRPWTGRRGGQARTGGEIVTAVNLQRRHIEGAAKGFQPANQFGVAGLFAVENECV